MPSSDSNTIIQNALNMPPRYGRNQHMVMQCSSHQTQTIHQCCQCIQEVIGILLYYAWAIDPMLLTTALGTLATQQAQGTQHL